MGLSRKTKKYLFLASVVVAIAAEFVQLFTRKISPHWQLDFIFSIQLKRIVRKKYRL
jgi:hypothetical protein